MRIPPGHSNKIRLTVAFAESYGLIAIFPRSVSGRGMGIVYDRQPMQMALAADLYSNDLRYSE